MPKKPTGPNVLVKFHLPKALHERLKAHCAVTRQTIGGALAELIQDYVFDYAKLRKNPQLLKALDEAPTGQ